MLRDIVLSLDRLSSLPIRTFARNIILRYRHNSILNLIRRMRDYKLVSMKFGKSSRLNKLNIGCGHNHKEGFINIDIYKAPAADYVLDATNIPLPSGSVKRIESYHVVEHLPYPTFKNAITEWQRLLCPEGQLVIELPDFDACVQEYLNSNLKDRRELLLEYIYGGQRHKTDIHYWGWNEDRLRSELAHAGFDVIEREEPQQDRPAPCLRMVARLTQ